MSRVSELTSAKPAVVAAEPGPGAANRIGRAIAVAILIAYSIFVFLPFLWSVVTSFKTLPDSLTLSFIPNPFTTYGYQQAFTQLDPNVLVLFFNSALIAALVTVSNVFLGALGGYAFARIRFPGREVLFLLVLGTMMIPDQLRLVPVYQILTFLRLVAPGPENYFGVFIILAVGASSLFIMRQFFLTVPYDLEEAAMLDGAGTFGTFWRVMLPISTPALAAVAILSFQGTWNGFFWPLVILQAKQHWTLPLGLTQFRFLYSTNWPPLMAMTVIATIPIVILYVFFQRYFVGGTVSAAVKG
jgi:multiple sugar transport system permease protein